MRKLSSLIIFLALSFTLFSQTSPHGAAFILPCTDCHNTSGWKIDMKNLPFDHGTTKFALAGQHQDVSCKLCHTSLEFAKSEKECISCHTDMHNQTVGPDCARCHTPASWVVNNITEMHQRSRFPLLGAHITADCFACHTNASGSLLNFGPLGIECIDCHQANYQTAKNPDHVQGGFSTNCVECHNLNAFSWTGTGFNHNIFPLTGGHAISNCQECHKTPDYSSTSPVCISCHLTNYNQTSNPPHQASQFPTTCSDCHTHNAWSPANWDHDNLYFPIYSGKHKNEWNTCTDCHPNQGNYAVFTCTTSCHPQSKMDNEHRGEAGYTYTSAACLNCHPNGNGGNMMKENFRIE